MASARGSKTDGRKASSGNPDGLSVDMAAIPPHSQVAEEAVIGAMLVDSDCVETALGELSKDSFYNPRHGMIFEAIRVINEAHLNVDYVTVVEQLTKSGELEAVGGPATLVDLSRSVGAAAHLEQHIQILKEKHILRKIIKASSANLTDAFDNSTNVDDIIVNAQARIFDAISDQNRTDIITISAAVNDAIEAMQAKQESGEAFSGVPSGIKSLDRKTMGFQPSDLVILAARPSVGKTAFAMNIARNAAVDYKQPVAIFSLEMPAIQLANRLIISETGLPADKIKGARKMEPYEWTQLETKLKALSEAPIYIDTTPSLPVYEFRSKAKRLVAQNNVKLIVVDYLQLMQGPKELRGMREQEVAAISKALKATAKELNIPIIALSQLSRQVTQRGGSNSRPQLSDLRESGSIEQDADIVMFLHRLDYQGLSENPEDVGKTFLILAKHRNGEIGEIELTFRSSEVKFVDAEDALYEQASGRSDSSINNMSSASAQDLSDGSFNMGDSYVGGGEFSGNNGFDDPLSY